MSIRVEQAPNHRKAPQKDPRATGGLGAAVEPVGVLLCAAAAGVLAVAVYAPPLVGLLAGLIVAVGAVVWARTGGVYSGLPGLLVAAGCAGLIAVLIAGVAGVTNFWSGPEKLAEFYDLYRYQSSYSDLTNDMGIGQNSGAVGSTAQESPATDTVVPVPSTPGRQAVTPPARLVPARIIASNSAPNSNDSAGAVVTYGPENTVDNDPRTAWRVPGDGRNQTLTLSWSSPVTVQSVALIPGYAKVDADGTDRFAQNRRVTVAEFEDSGGRAFAQLTFTDSPTMQGITLTTPVVTTSLTVRVLGTTQPGGRDFTAISEIYIGGLS